VRHCTWLAVSLVRLHVQRIGYNRACWLYAIRRPCRRGVLFSCLFRMQTRRSHSISRRLRSRANRPNPPVRVSLRDPRRTRHMLQTIAPPLPAACRTSVLWMKCRVALSTHWGYFETLLPQNEYAGLTRFSRGFPRHWCFWVIGTEVVSYCEVI